MAEGTNSGDLSAMFFALADPSRREMLERLKQGSMSASLLGASFGFSQPAASKHLSVLQRAGLITVERRGRSRIYTANPAGLKDASDWIARLSDFWARSLSRLDALVAEDQARMNLDGGSAGEATQTNLLQDSDP